MAYAEMMGEDGNDRDRAFATISIMTGADVDEVKRWSMDSFNRVWGHLAFLQQPIIAKRTTSLKLGGKRYTVNSNPKRMTYGQFTDLMHFVKTEADAVKNLHHAFACCLVERGRWPWSKSDYNGENHEAVALAVLDVPITAVKPNTDFFLRNYLAYSRRIVIYSGLVNRVLERRMRQQATRSIAPTAG